MMPPETRIAGQKTVEDWLALKDKLVVGSDAPPWKEAFEEFFCERLKTRYFTPIEKLEEIQAYKGEGFSIVVIQCSLIEFLASAVEGKTYRRRQRNDPPLDKEIEYSDSGDMFRSFLRDRVPFKEMFADDAAAAGKFYSNVRCGLFHEAMTKGGWRIRVCQNAEQAIDTKKKIVYRNKMQEAFDQFTQWYGDQLPQCAKLQQAFIRKFDSLCED